MKLLGLLFLLMTNFAMSSEGGDRVGNGGDVIICKENGEENVYVLDEYEAESHGSVGSVNLNYEQKILILIERVKKDFPARYDFYSSLFQYYKKNVTFSPKKLPEVNDTSVSTASNCNMFQAAFFKQSSNNQNAYFLQREIWNRLTEDQKAILVFHEILYTEAVGLGHSTSIHVRRANRYVFLAFPFQANYFDEAFMIPLKKTPRTAGLVIQQLENAYSESIATYLLNLDLSGFYANKELVHSLQTLRKRFKSSSVVEHLVDEHLRHFENL